MELSLRLFDKVRRLRVGVLLSAISNRRLTKLRTQSTLAKIEWHLQDLAKLHINSAVDGRQWPEQVSAVS